MSIPMTNETVGLQKTFCSQALLAAIVIALMLLAVDAKPMAKGVVLGTLFSILNFIMIAIALPIQIDPSRRKTFVLSLGSVCARYLLLGLPLAIAVKVDTFDFYATATGLFAVQGVIIFHHLKKLIFKKQ